MSMEMRYQLDQERRIERLQTRLRLGQGRCKTLGGGGELNEPAENFDERVFTEDRQPVQR